MFDEIDQALDPMYRKVRIPLRHHNWIRITLSLASQSSKEEVDNQKITFQAVADMIHELADGAQFITTTFRF